MTGVTVACPWLAVPLLIHGLLTGGVVYVGFVVKKVTKILPL